MIDDGSSLIGRAFFKRQEAETLAYHEQGWLRLANGEGFEAFRRYIFRRTPGGFTVLFAETPPRLFHTILLSAGPDGLTGEAGHDCAPDQYESRYVFRASGRFTVRHVVHGPRKDYTMTTRYAPLVLQGVAP